MIKAVSNNLNVSKTQSKSQNVSFGMCEAALPKEVISKKSKKLLKALEEVLTEQLVEIRKKKGIPGENLGITKYNDRAKTGVTITPVYNNPYEDMLQMEIKRFDATDVITVSRRNPENFKYEKRVPTITGYATTKTYNSRTQSNENIEEKVDMLLQEYLPLFLKKTGRSGEAERRYITHRDIV